MIAFYADNHYQSRPGYNLNQRLGLEEEIRFAEDDLSSLPETIAREDCRLLILNLISDTPGMVHPGPEVGIPLKAYIEGGRPVLLLHGASAAFHQWDWWRRLVGFRWVRGNDPDGFAASTHPVRPYSVKVAKTRHPLASQLKPFNLPTDEIYINLEQTCPAVTLMETTVEEGTFPQAYITETPYGGQIAAFIPGHAAHAFDSPELVGNVRTLIRYLTD